MKNNRAIWLFAGGPMQEIVAKKIIEEDYRLLLTDANLDCVCAKYADEFIDNDTFDIRSNVEIAEKLKEKYDIRAVLTVAADCHETVAHVGRSLQLHALNPKISIICRQKAKTREILVKNGIPQPKYRIISTLDGARAFIEEIGGCGVIKSTDNSGSRGFTAIRGLGELTDHVFEKALSEGTTGKAIVEELLIPVDNQIAEQSVETVWFNGKMYWLNWVDRLFRKDFQFFKNLPGNIFLDLSWGVELGHLNPAIHEKNIRNDVSELVYRAGLAIGMGEERGGHIIKADVMLTKNGPVILELTPRLSGGWDSSRSTPLRGGDFVGGALSLALGEELNLDMWLKYFHFRNPEIHSAILAMIQQGAKDCIGRIFAQGTGVCREDALGNAYANLREGKHVDSMEQ